MTAAKANFSPDVGGLAFFVQDGVVVFDKERIEMTSDEALAPPIDANQGAFDDARRFLEKAIEPQVVDADEIMQKTKEASISRRTLQKAKADLGIKSIRDDDHWVWSIL